MFEERTPVGDKSLLGRSQNAFERIYQETIQMSRNTTLSNEQSSQTPRKVQYRIQPFDTFSN